jgi:DNA-binding IscR family transcriptional regulator
MERDSRLSLVLHALLHLAHSKRPVTSEELGVSLRTNAVVVRRTLAGLRKAGWVESVKGHGGGWSIVCDLDALTLADVYRALGEPVLLAMRHRDSNPRCVVEQVVNRAIDDTFHEAEALVLAKFGQVTLGGLMTDFSRRMALCEQEKHEERKHAL